MTITNPKPLAIVGIHTDIGKTVFAAVLTQMLRCDYWKPVQAGGLDCTDSDAVRAGVSNPLSVIHPEGFRLKTAASPHVAAHIDGVSIALDDLTIPQTTRPLLIETAGGVASPMTNRHTVADVVAHHGWATVLVVRHYLGSISHTLSAIESLRGRGVNLLGLVISGDTNPESERFLTDYADIRIIARVPQLADLTPPSIAAAAQHLNEQNIVELTPWMTHD